MVTITEVKRVFSLLEKDHPLTMLEELGDYSPFQMLVMTLLSSRTKDSTTIPIVKKLFAKHPKPEDFVDMNIKELEESLFSIGFYKVKAKHVKKLRYKRYPQQMICIFCMLFSSPYNLYKAYQPKKCDMRSLCSLSPTC